MEIVRRDRFLEPRHLVPCKRVGLRERQLAIVRAVCIDE
jgi:hypothetical protein